MATFPTDFANSPEPLRGGLGEPDSDIKFLADRGLVVLSGLTREHAGVLTQLALQPHIKEYCPNDCTDKRFASLESTQRWLKAGRGVFLLAKESGSEYQVVGYGWVGSKETPEVPGGKTTFALRLGKEALGQKLSVPFSKVILEAAKKLYGAANIWLETWQSNEAAVHGYQKLGFQLVNKKSAKRKTGTGQELDDTRLFMKLEP